MELVYLGIGIVIGLLIGYLLAKLVGDKYKGVPQDEHDKLNDQLNELNSAKIKLEERNSYLNEELNNQRSELEKERKLANDYSNQLSKMKADYDNMEKRLAEQKKELEEIQKQFTTEFENLANKILEEKTQKFTSQNKENLDNILNPLNEKIKDFEKKVNEVYVNESKDRSAIINEIKHLAELNQQMAKDANNLTRALKGDTKTQGNWGEFILESILEKSGLEKDREYIVQQTVKSEDGSYLRPDVLVKLPENKNMIIDSKVSLNAYESFVSAEDGEQRKKALNAHITSVRKHIKELSEKSYQNLYELQSLDFVLMFIPIEPALGLAVQNDGSLFEDAFKKNIVIVSPSTLLATLRTIANIWKQEKQNRNAMEIARQSGELYDKFVGFLEDLEKLGKNIETTKNTYDSAFKKLGSGKGNLIRRVEKIKELGANSSKEISQNLLDDADE